MTDAGDYRARARELYEKNGSTDSSPALKEHRNPEQLIEELRIHQIELELQNQDLWRARKESEKAREHYFLLFDMAPTAYLVVDSYGTIVEANLRAAELFGRNRRNMSGRKLSRSFAAEDAGRVEIALELAAKGQSIDEEWYTLRSPEKTERFVHLRIAPWQDESDGEEKRFLVSIVDETDRKLREDEQQRAVERYRVLLRELNHRIKNNLQILSSIVELERRKGASEDVFNTIVDRIKGVARAHNALHEASKDVDAVDLSDMLNSVAVQAKQHLPDRIDLKYVRGPKDMVLTADHGLTVSLIVNELITNAIQHAFPEGRGGTIRVELFQTDGRAHMSVIDDGVGMDTSEPTKNARIGTQLVMQLVDELGGSWDMSSPHQDGPGLRHDIEFPLQSK